MPNALILETVVKRFDVMVVTKGDARAQEVPVSFLGVTVVTVTLHPGLSHVSWFSI